MICVLLLEDDDDLRETLAMALEEPPIERVLAVKSLQELIGLGPRALVCRCVLLDVNLGPGESTGLDACAWLLENGYRGRVVYLTGHAASYPQLRQAAQKPNTFLLEKPTRLPNLLQMVEEACT